MIGERSYTKRKSVKTTKTAYINNVLLENIHITYLPFLPIEKEKNLARMVLNHHIKLPDGL